MIIELNTSEITRLNPEDNPNKVGLYILREDLIHPIVSGNKWRKLKYNLLAARESGESTLLSFGGAYSNHIHALAAAAKETGLKSIGIIRGEEHLPLNPTLTDAKAMGMELHYMDRTSYRLKDSLKVFESLKQQFGKFYLIPEGGTNKLAIKGAAGIVENIENDYDYFCLACGTGGTTTGVISGLNGKGEVLGFSVLKGVFHHQEIKNWLEKIGQGKLNNWQINSDYHFGGYANFDNRLIMFINNFKKNHNIQLDPIYTGKMMYGVLDLIGRGKFRNNARILAIHTGGLQGIMGFNQRFGQLILM